MFFLNFLKILRQNFFKSKQKTFFKHFLQRILLLNERQKNQKLNILFYLQFK